MQKITEKSDDNNMNFSKILKDHSKISAEEEF